MHSSVARAFMMLGLSGFANRIAPTAPQPSGLKRAGKIRRVQVRFKSGRYQPHQGKRECARRVRQMEKLAAVATGFCGESGERVSERSNKIK